VSRVTSLGHIPVVIVSSGDQSPEIIARHRELTRLSSEGRHIVATSSGHWIQFDEPALVIAAVRQLVERVRSTNGPAL
jgi:pimeloyl-ACP methyl ester carboxylesterase